VPLARERFRNQGGRAARFGRERRFGRSILIARDGEEMRRLSGLYLRGEDESLPPALAGRGLEAIVCDLAASRIAKSRGDAAALLEGSYTSTILWSADRTRFQRDLDSAVDEAKAKDLLVEQADGRLEATGLGRVVAIQGIQPATAGRFAQWIRPLGSRRPAAAEMLLIAALTPDGEDFPVPVRGRERSSPAYGAAIAEIIGEAAQTDEILRAALDPPGGWTEDLVAATKKCMILHHWIGPTETAAIEEQSGMFSGTIVNLAHHFQWLVQAIGAVAEALGGRRTLATAADQLARRLFYGVEPKCLRLAAVKVEAMTRGYLRTLVREGFDSARAVAQADPEQLARWIPRRVADELVARARYEMEQRKAREESERLAAAARRPGSRRRTKPAARRASKRTAAKPGLPKLTIDEANPERVIVNDTTVSLTPYPWELLRLLARNAGRLVTYREIDEALWPDAKVEPQQISAHKRSVVQALGKVVGPDIARELVETLPRRGLRLNLPPENIRRKE
jgi:replicative superfamily II helicase